MKKKVKCLLLPGFFLLAMSLLVKMQYFNAEDAWPVMQGFSGEEEVEKKKIAITFDDDVIIGLSQEISYKEAVSMI